MDQWNKPTAAMMIAKVIELRDKLDEKTKAYKESIKDDEANIELLENLLGEEINRLGGQSIRTAYGTAFRTTVTSFRCTDREAWLDWVFTNNQRDLLTANVAKDAVKEYADSNGLPPGLNMTMIHKTLVRRPE